MDQILSKLDSVLKNKETIIITDPFIVQRKELRQFIHEKCRRLGIKSSKYEPSGTSGTYMVIRPELIEVCHNLVAEELGQFVRLCKIPIDKKLLSSEEIFKYQMDTLETFHKRLGKPGSKSPWELFALFLEVKEEADREGRTVTGYIANLETVILDHIRHKEEYKKFFGPNAPTKRKEQQDGMNKEKEEREGEKEKGKKTYERSNMHSTSPYQIGVPNESYKISIDIITANFTMLYLTSPDLVDGFSQWSDFIGQFTKLQFFVFAKTFRQEVLGKLNAKRIAGKEKELLKSIVEPLRNENIIIDGNINSDEIILETCQTNMLKDYYKVNQILNSLPHSQIWRVEIFKVRPLLDNPVNGFYPFVRNNLILNSTINNDTTNMKCWTEFCCMPKIYTMQAIKFYLGEKIRKRDRVFSDEYGNIHTFDYPIFH